MTSLIAWVGVDPRGPSSVYIASDSRFTYKYERTVAYWDYGRKIFACQKHPDIFGYSGTVDFPSLLLGQITDLADAGLLYSQSDEHGYKFNTVTATIKKAFDSLPTEQKTIDFAIVYATRQGENRKGEKMDATFHVYSLERSPIQGWKETAYPMPAHSDIICHFGSGGSKVMKWYETWSKTPEARTSRAVFGAFCDAINSGDDTASGGAPQLVGLKRINPALLFGTVYNEKLYIYGFPVEPSDKLDAVNWRNALFERCSWMTKEPLEEAKKHRHLPTLGTSIKKAKRK